MIFSKYIIPRNGAILLGIVICFLIYLGTREANGLPTIPYYYEWPIVLGPFVTIVVSTLVFGEYLAAGKGDGWRHILAILWTISMCVALVTFKGWLAHLAPLWLTFAGFWLWDRAMISDADGRVTDRDKLEVKQGNRYINRPTFFASLAAIIYLMIGNYFDWFHVNVGTSVDESLIRLKATTGELSNPLEVFTSGLVGFHLIFSASSYSRISFSTVP